jgi:hypothetical protein
LRIPDARHEQSNGHHLATSNRPLPCLEKQ